MNGDTCLPDKSQLAREILSYLAKHPDAQDTLDGIARIWLSGRGNAHNPTLVQEVIKDLVLVGTLLESKTPDSPALYRLNVAKWNKVKA
jgi:hypothetical protein